jgi:hypothetical protein
MSPCACDGDQRVQLIQRTGLEVTVAGRSLQSSHSTLGQDCKSAALQSPWQLRQQDQALTTGFRFQVRHLSAPSQTQSLTKAESDGCIDDAANLHPRTIPASVLPGVVCKHSESLVDGICTPAMCTATSRCSVPTIEPSAHAEARTSAKYYIGQSYFCMQDITFKMTYGSHCVSTTSDRLSFPWAD